MNKKVNIISAISYAARSGITAFTINPSGTVSITAAAWVSIPYVYGSVDYTVDETNDKAGTRYEIKLSARLREVIDIPLCILRIDFEDDDTEIIGDLDHPVRLVKGKALLKKNLATTHMSWREPYILSV